MTRKLPHEKKYELLDILGEASTIAMQEETRMQQDITTSDNDLSDKGPSLPNMQPPRHNMNIYTAMPPAPQKKRQVSFNNSGYGRELHNISSTSVATNIDKEIKYYFNRLKAIDDDFKFRFASGNTKLEAFVNMLDTYTKRKKRKNSLKLSNLERKHNHLKSEHTRRDAINNGLDAIKELIPLKNKKSKKTIVIEALWYILKIKTELVNMKRSSAP